MDVWTRPVYQHYSEGLALFNVLNYLVIQSVPRNCTGTIQRDQNYFNVLNYLAIQSVPSNFTGTIRASALRALVCKTDCIPHDYTGQRKEG